MKRAMINLSPRPFRNDNLYRLIYAGCICVLLLVSAANLALLVRHGWSLAMLRGELRAQREALAGLDQRETGFGKALVQVDSAELQDRAEFANTAILRRVFSWTQLFNVLEQIVPPDVKLRAVRPVVDAHGEVDIQLEGTARNYLDFVSLEEALMTSPAISRVYPDSERLESATYRGGAPALPLAAPRPAGGTMAAGEVGFRLSFQYLPAGKPGAAAPGGAGR